MSRADRFPAIARQIHAPTALNLRLSAAYDRCGGKHKPSGDTVQRDFGTTQRSLPVCRKCKVPFGGPRQVSSKQRWNGTDGGAG